MKLSLFNGERAKVATSRQEAQWVLRAQCNDREALESLLRSVQPRLRRYLCGLVGAFHADDVLQEVLSFILVFLILFFAVQAGLVWLGHLSQTADVKTMVICSVAVLLVGEVAAAVVTWGIVVEATRKT